MYGIYVATYEAGVEVSDILFENNSIENVFSFDGQNISNITVRDIPDTTRRFTINDVVSNLQIEFTDGKVFGEDSPDTPHWYPKKSNLSITGTGTVTLTMYNMTALPASDSADITVNKFDTSLPQGEILVNFTANTTDGNNVVFTVWSLKPSYYYLIKRDGFDFATKQPNSSGYIQFNNSEWSTRIFTIEESSDKRKLPVARPVCATGIAILIVIAYWRYRRRRRRMRSGGLIVLVPGITIDWLPFIYN